MYYMNGLILTTPEKQLLVRVLKLATTEEHGSKEEITRIRKILKWINNETEIHLVQPRRMLREPPKLTSAQLAEIVARKSSTA